MTDDEREALLREARRAQKAVFLATDADVAVDLSRIIRGLADALEACSRHSDAPEPSAECPKCGVRVTDQTPSTFYTHHDETCGGALEEPQGEPSDARVRSVWDALGPSVTVHLDFEDLRAALRAAGGAR